MQYFLAEPARGPVDFQLKLLGWSVVVDYFVAPGFVPVAPDSELAAVIVAVDFAHPVGSQQPPNSK